MSARPVVLSVSYKLLSCYCSREQMVRCHDYPFSMAHLFFSEWEQVGFNTINQKGNMWTVVHTECDIGISALWNPFISSSLCKPARVAECVYWLCRTRLFLSDVWLAVSGPYGEQKRQNTVRWLVIVRWWFSFLLDTSETVQLEKSSLVIGQ